MNLFLKFFELNRFKVYPKINLLFCSLCIGVFAFAQGGAPPVFKGKAIQLSTESLKNKFHHFSAFQLESKKLSQLVHENTISSFRLDISNDKQWDIDLEPAGITTADYHLKVLTPQGTQTLTSHGDFLFKGKVKGSNKDEQVRLAIKDGFIYGSIQAGGKEYFIEPSNRFTGTKGKDVYVMYEANDVINKEIFSCGVQDEEASIKEAQQQNNLREQSPQNIICKKIKFIPVADYSIYQKFGGDVYAVETALLANLNLAEGAFTTLNFGPDGSTDVGTDQLQFAAEQMVVSICNTCDMVSNNEYVLNINDQFNAWILREFEPPYNRIYQFWTTRNLYYLNDGAVVGTAFNFTGCECGYCSKELLKYNSDDPAFLRVLVAHETGHAFGCPHDNAVKPDVTGFIMYSGADGSRTRFSTLADFGGVNYSSQQTIRNTVLQHINCMGECGVSLCEDVLDLKVNYFNAPDSIQLTWRGSGNFLAQYRIEDSIYHDWKKIETISGNSITLKGLNSCTLYRFEVQRLCNADTGRATSIIFNTSSLAFTATPVNLRSDKYDLKLSINCKNCSGQNYTVRIDKRPYFLSADFSSNVVIADLFADGAPHRVVVEKDSSSKACRSESIFTAPYYRSNSSKILSADWNDCNMPAGWKDSLLAKSVSASPDARWLIENKNFFTLTTSRGSFDSSCMIYYNNHNGLTNPYNGALSLTSPVVDLTRYRVIKLHFDYNFLSYFFPAAATNSSITVQVYDGNSWQTIMKRKGEETYPRTAAGRRMIWDSLPSRVFLDLDRYANKNFQVRFIADDGSLEFGKSTLLFAAFDNIQIDGYPLDVIANDFMIYPNPAREEVFIQFAQPALPGISYNIIDANGRTVKYGLLNNYRIDLRNLPGGVYFLRLYQNNQQIGNAKKIIKQ
ncbi:MAG TPA: T9SS type A sorting domain-containing protein [Chitinophagaceae bacterium]|jgi:hypothetical protein|nr:T9SS type A sorting domain-containing protein [Chitinophagaceae bacterium]